MRIVQVCALAPLFRRPAGLLAGAAVTLAALCLNDTFATSLRCDTPAQPACAMQPGGQQPAAAEPGSRADNQIQKSLAHADCLPALQRTAHPQPAEGQRAAGAEDQSVNRQPQRQWVSWLLAKHEVEEQVPRAWRLPHTFQRR
jgi:hypothetical protein